MARGTAHERGGADVRPGETYWFEYHCTETEDSTDAELWHHTHQQATILRELGDDERDLAEVGRMFRVRFPDGFEWDVMEDELVTSPREFDRPDYEDWRLRGRH